MPSDSALHRACRNGDVNGVRDLLRAGHDINARGANGRTPLHRAAGGGHVELVKFLLQQHADSTLRDGNGRLPLHWACLSGHTPCVRLFLSELLPIPRAFDPLDVARQAASEQQSEGKDDDTSTIEPSASEGTGSSTLLLKGMPVRGLLPGRAKLAEAISASPGSLGSLSPTRSSHAEGKDEMGSDSAGTAGTATRLIDCISANGWSPLHFAASANALELLNYLLDSGADRNTLDQEGLSAWDVGTNLGFKLPTRLKDDAKNVKRYYGLRSHGSIECL